MKYFLSVVNLDIWNIFEETEEGYVETILATKEMSIGDIIYFYVGKESNTKEAGIYAIGEVVSKPYIYMKHSTDYCYNKNSVDVKITKMNFDEPFLTYNECKNYVHQFQSTHNLEEAGAELYEVIVRNKKKRNINKIVKKYMEDNNPDQFLLELGQDLKVRNAFVEKFTIPFIMNMDYDDYVIGKAETSETGRNSFCYLIERKMQKLGEARGSVVDKFGFWYDKKTQQYRYGNGYGATEEEAFDKIKEELISLITNGNNHNYDGIKKSLFPPTFKGKILTTYFPDAYLGIFKEEDIDKFLNVLHIHYDVYEYNTAEKKKQLLKQFKMSNSLLNKVSDYYFVKFLYDTFKHELEIEHTVNGEIDYHFEFETFHYVGSLQVEKKKQVRSRDTDYEKMNRNKKDIGDRGETAVVNYEIKKLENAKRLDLATKVHINENDAAGYDIDSFDENGNEIHIEVKTNSSSSKGKIEFYFTNNELNKMIEDSHYYIYYLYNIKGKTKCHIIDKQNFLENKDQYLTPIAYKVGIEVEKK